MAKRKFVVHGNRQIMKNRLAYLRKFSSAVNYAGGIYAALVAIGFNHPKMKEFSDML